MKFLKNKLFIGILCIILGLLVGFAAIPRLRESEEIETVTAVRLNQDIAAGTRITGEMLETVTVSDGVLPEGAITDSASVSGSYAASQLYAGDYLTPNKLTDSISTQDAMALATEKGMRVISVTLPTLAAGVSGQLQPGDIVTVLAIPENSSSSLSLTLEPEATEDNDTGTADTPETLLYPELQYIEVCAVTASDGSAAVVNPNPSEDEKNSLPETLSLYVTEAQALRLVELEQKGMIHLAFVARGAEAARYIPDDRRILNTEVTGE